MSDWYVEEFLYRGRCKTCESKKQSTYQVTLARWVPAPDGSSEIVRKGPLTPESAEAMGFNLEKIVGEMAAGALRDRGHAIKSEKAQSEKLLRAERALLASQGEAKSLRAQIGSRSPPSPVSFSPDAERASKPPTKGSPEQ